jgi:F-type H+-transporting ATPase subunit delta
MTGDAAVLARRYAGALYDLAEEQNKLDAIAADMTTVRGLYDQCPEFRYLANQPRLSRAQLIKAMYEVAAAAGFNPLTTNFLSLVAQNRRLPKIGPIVDAFLAELAARRGEYMADVRTAHALTPLQHEQLSAKLRVLAGGKVHFSVREDVSLLGGIIVKMGSRLIDASVKGKLARLERQLKSQSVYTQEGAA